MIDLELKLCGQFPIPSFKQHNGCQLILSSNRHAKACYSTSKDLNSDIGNT